MDVSLQEKLVILLDKATNPLSSELDVATIDAFCCAVKNEPASSIMATKLLADRIQSANPNESLNALNLLDECMGKCGEGHRFQNTVGTFRFLNELVKLVSPKYLASQTDQQVKNKILDLLLLWTVQFPKESKVKEAYEMLRRQGVVHQSPNPITIQKKQTPPPPVKPTQSIAVGSSSNQDPTSLKIKQLIQSKNPGPVDIHAANLLIQNYYEIEKKKTLRVQEIRKGRENVSVLNEMIDHFSVSESTSDDLALIRELYESCKSLQPTILLLTEDPQSEEQVLQDALETNDQLMQVVAKYESIISVQGHSDTDRGVEEIVHDDALIDMQMGDVGQVEGVDDLPGDDSVNSNNLNELEKIFGSLKTIIDQPTMIPTDDKEMLSPESVTKGSIKINRPGVAVPIKTSEKSIAPATKDMDSMISEILKATVSDITKTSAAPTNSIQHDFNGIAAVDLDSIEPASDRTILNDPKGLKVVLNFTKEHPREDVAVIVVSVANQSPNLVTDIELSLEPTSSECQAKVVWGEKAGRSLSGVKRFSSAVDDLAVVVLVSNPSRVKVPSWSIIVKYCVEGQSGQKQETLTVADMPDLF